MTGVACVLAAYFLYAVGDAAAKWLVGTLSVWEILFIRSAIGLLLCCAIYGRRALAAARHLAQSRGLLLMNLANFGGWAAYYSAAGYLPLPQLFTIYYLSPIIAALLAGPLLGERIHATSAIAAALGFAGVLITTAPAATGLPAVLPALLGIAAALMWSLSSILYRRHAREFDNREMLVCSNITIGILSALPLLGTWRGVGAGQAGVLAIVAVAGLAAHFFYISGVRRVPVAVAGPISYLSLVWSALLAYVIWGDVPHARLLLGGGLILMAGLLIIGHQWRSGRGKAG